jgi:spore coat protein U-like protein
MLKPTLLALAIVAASASAWADTQTTTFNVLLTITKACNFTTAATDVNFGSVASTATNVQNVGNLRVTCTKGTGYNIGLSAGNGTAATVGARTMKGATAGNTDEVGYTLYREIGRTSNWGNTVGTDTVAGTGTGLEQNVPVYGALASANFTADTYSDVITATVTY